MVQCIYALNNQYGNNVHGAQPTPLQNFSNLTEKLKKITKK